ncbi:hypothetical protein KKQ10_17950 [Pseudomonas sp. MG-9]|uniref:hypothetical protein n=1 Tax=Pseudomonas sp. MG-9 TaxID=2839032 RepID=UPI001BFFE0A5|nr:hypothetical protein [Pseudomonas sp. MG-9]MBT9266771.1 hypothetical protein [Pseudomonas sp. MG-9]
MNVLAYEFSAAQRRVLDHYIRFLGALPMTFNAIPLVCERRRKEGHQLAVLARDSRLNNAPFNQRYLQEFWARTEASRLLGAGYIGDLEVFTRESLDIAGKTSRHEPVSQVDFRLFSLSRSASWKLFPAQNVAGLIHELALRFYVLSAETRRLKHTVVEVHDESFGLKSVFVSAMDHRSCLCHTTPTVAQGLFGDPLTTPVWDLAYASTDPAIRAAEYKADVVALFSGFVSVSTQMGLFIEGLYQRLDGLCNQLLQAMNAVKLSELNFKLAAITENANECMAMLNHLEVWLRK